VSEFPELPPGPQGLSQAFFDECYAVLAKKIQDETPWPVGKTMVPPEMQRQQWIEQASSDLAYWQGYALDGDLSLLPAQPDGPWWLLVDKGNELYASAYSDLESACQNLPHQWQGEAHNHAAGYLDTTKNLVGGYCPNPGNAESGIVNEAAIALQGAYATAVAFKMDLYHLAKRADDALDDLEKGGTGELVGVGLIVAGLALSGAGGAGQAKESIAAAFAGGVLSALGGLALNKGMADVKAAQPVGGRDPQEIMRTLAKATNQAQLHYSQAAGRAGDSLSQVWREIDGQMRYTMMRPVPGGAAPDVSPDGSLRTSRFFPAG
jgi:hypothetical protein